MESGLYYTGLYIKGTESMSKELKNEMAEEFKQWIAELENLGELEEYENKVKTKYPLGFERHPFEEGLKRLSGWYFWHGRGVEKLDDFRAFIDEYIDIIYATFENKEQYKDIGLDGFMLRMKQGETFKLEGTEFFPVSVMDNVKAVYRKGYGRQYDVLEGDLIGLLDCRNNRLIVGSFYIDKLEMLLPEFNKDYKDDTPESRKKVKELYNITFMSEIFEEVNKLICRYKSDRACENVENKRLIVKDMDLDYKKEYDNIQKLAMGINNYLYISFKRMENSEIYPHVLGYMERDLEYLHDLVFNNSEVNKETWKLEQYLSLVKTYSNIKGDVNRLIETEIKSAVDGKNSVYVNDKQFKDIYCYLSSNEHEGEIRVRSGKSVPLSKVETLKYSKKEIFNREKAAKRIESPEFQAGINGLIVFVRNHFDRYGKGLETDAEIGDLVFTDTGHFGIVTSKDRITLDDGRQENIAAGNIFIKGKEMNKGLAEIKRFIENENGLSKRKSAEQELGR